MGTDLIAAVLGAWCVLSVPFGCLVGRVLRECGLRDRPSPAHETRRSSAEVGPRDRAMIIDPSIGVGKHEVQPARWGALARRAFQENPGVVHYPETECFDSETHQTYVSHVAKGADRTPHQLPRAAEARVAELEAEPQATGAHRNTDCRCSGQQPPRPSEQTA